jgi:nitrogen fixation NifU-like protein
MGKMSDLEELYQEIIMEHNRRPKNFRALDDAGRSANGFNPFCGDTITLYLDMADDVIAEVGFQGSGCAISRASASMMTESIKGKSSAEAEAIFQDFHQMLTRGPDGEFDSERLGDLELLAGVSEFPTRIKCAILSWHTLKAALKGQEETVKTE